VRAARNGLWLEFDGLDADGVDAHAALVNTMKHNGLLHRVLVSHDAGWFPVGEPGGGELLRVKSLMLKPLLARYKKLLRQAGRETVENGRLSEETAAALEKPIISDAVYIKTANQHWDKLLEKRGED